jgi:hypothetical protein
MSHRESESDPGTRKITGHIISASIRQFPPTLATILLAVSLLTVDGRLQRCFYETQTTQSGTLNLLYMLPSLVNYVRPNRVHAVVTLTRVREAGRREI